MCLGLMCECSEVKDRPSFVMGKKYSSGDKDGKDGKHDVENALAHLLFAHAESEFLIKI